MLDTKRRSSKCRKSRVRFTTTELLKLKIVRSLRVKEMMR